MAALLGWQQKWSASGLNLDAAWSDGFALGSVTLAAVGHSGFTPAPTLTYGVVKELPALTLAVGGRTTLLGNPLSELPTVLALGSRSLGLRGALTTATSGFDTQDPMWLDSPLTVVAGGRMSFPSVVTIQQALSHPLGAVALGPIGHLMSVAGSLTSRVTKPLGTPTLNMIGGVDATATTVMLDAPPHDPGTNPLPVVPHFGFSTVTVTSLLPAHEIGAATLSLSGAPSVSVVTLFSGGPYTIATGTVTARGGLGLSGGFSYPPFDVNPEEIKAKLDPSVTSWSPVIEADDVHAH